MNVCKEQVCFVSVFFCFDYHALAWEDFRWVFCFAPIAQICFFIKSLVQLLVWLSGYDCHVSVFWGDHYGSIPKHVETIKDVDYYWVTTWIGTMKNFKNSTYRNSPCGQRKKKDLYSAQQWACERVE